MERVEKNLKGRPAAPLRARQLFCGIGLAGEVPHRSNQGRDCAPVGNRICRVAPMPESVPITPRCSRRLSAVHPAAPVRHRRRPARAPSPCPRSTSGAAVHGQSALHGIDPPISVDPHPPGARRMPTTACPPEWTWTCSTVTFCSPLPRWRFSVSRSSLKVRESLLAWFRFSRRPSKDWSLIMARR